MKTTIERQRKDMVKANVLIHLKAAQQQIDAAMKLLSGGSEIRNELFRDVDGPLDSIVLALESGDYPDYEL